MFLIAWKDNIKTPQIFQSVHALRLESSVEKFENRLRRFENDWLDDNRLRMIFPDVAIFNRARLDVQYWFRNYASDTARMSKRRQVS